MFIIKDELKKLPPQPGVYLMKNDQGEIIYVGKAINLRNRVRQYFQSSSNLAPKIESMVQEVCEFEFIVTDSELEALILECNLIKKYWPRYNTLLKDDKSYPYINVTNDYYQKIFKVNKVENDKAKYFGPYTSNFAVLEILAVMTKLWPLRQCNRAIGGKNQRPCLNHHIGRCNAPCNGGISQEEYNANVEKALEFLNGKQDKVIKQLEEEMYACSEKLEFEKAASLRDKIQAINRLSQRQKLEHASNDEHDVIAFARTENDAMFQVFFVRGGKMVGRENYLLQGVDALSNEETISEFLKQFYSDTTYVPRELILQYPASPIIHEYIELIKGKKVKLTIPMKGDKQRLVMMAVNNAEILVKQSSERLKKDYEQTIGALKEIAGALKVNSELLRIEAYDISNVQGYESVGSMVVFERGKPKNNDYRKFRLKTVSGPDDYASMAEVISRRFMRYKKEKEEIENGADELKAKFLTLPDIIFIDGGKGQVNAALQILSELEINLPVCGLVKDDRHRTRGIVYNSEEITFPTNSEAFKLITRIQDEVHRFAVEYHRKLRAQAQVRSVLDDIPGVGPRRRLNLMKHFGSIDAIKRAELSALASAPGMTKKTAQTVFEFFHIPRT